MTFQISTSVPLGNITVTLMLSASIRLETIHASVEAHFLVMDIHVNSITIL